ncbi:MAG: cupin domain-containing protein [Pseudomonadota bacterium]
MTLDSKRFLAEYWQKKPLLIRSGIENTGQLISPEELAGLACEEGIESRLVTHFNNQWELTHGPIPEETFLNLPNKDWTVLVQSVDVHVPSVASLLDNFTFLPRWRIDDVMVSYATQGGTVSAHYDYYDVFLIQGKGSRKWQVGEFCGPETALVPDMPMKILSEFEPTQEWVLHPGDILYIPPRMSHYGVALEDCMTYSVGFRAPSKSQLVDLFATHSMAEMGDEHRYEDTPETLSAGHYEINKATLERVRQSIIELANDDDVLLSAMAEITTRNKDSTEDPGEPYEWTTHVIAGATISRSESSRFSYYSGSPTALFADGAKIPASINLARFICESGEITVANLNAVLAHEGAEDVIAELLANNSLQIHSD